MEQNLSENKTIDLNAAFDACKPRILDWGNFTIPFIISTLLLSCVSFLFFPIGLMWSFFYMASRALDNKPAKVSDLWEGPGKVGTVGAIIGTLVIGITPGLVSVVGSILTGILAKVLGGLGAAVGGLLTFVVVIAASLMLIYALPIYVRQNCGAIDAMKRSVALFKAHVGGSFKLFLAMMVSMMIPFIGGPFAMLLLMHGYQQLEPEAASPAFAD